MASKKIFHAKTNHIYPANIDNPINNDDELFELEEADVWNSIGVASQPLEGKKMIPSSRSSKKVTRKSMEALVSTPVTFAASLPVNIPDWSKIYKQEYREHQKDGDNLDDDFDCDDYEGDQGSYRVPPHECLARRRGASFSVHEGIGRTLKGRDLRQVRNAIWEKVGFED